MLLRTADQTEVLSKGLLTATRRRNRTGDVRHARRRAMPKSTVVAMFLRRSSQITPPDLETVRKKARILVIDDQVFPVQELFERDGYHFERWATIRNLSQLTDGHYDLILLDLQGVGLKESLDRQGLGILQHIKKSNPAQAVIAYSAKRQTLLSSETLTLADARLDKARSYVDFKEKVDDLLLRHATPGYFVAAMNRELGEYAAHAPKAVPKALHAFKRGRIDGLTGYLEQSYVDRAKIDTIASIVSVGIKVIEKSVS